MSSFKTYSILALVAALCFVLLITFQVVELMHYGADPSIWPTGH